MLLINYAKDTLLNYYSNWLGTKLTYLIENDWSIKQDGINITSNLRIDFKSRVSLSFYGLRNQIVHFGSENIFMGKRGCHFPEDSNKTVLTWFHVLPTDIARLKILRNFQKKICFIHTASSITENQLISAGLEKKKIVKIPLGVYTNIFRPISINNSKKLRQELGLPTDRIIIGSFQKDGVGWGEGLKPKLIKGPDIFVDVVKKLKSYNPYVLLTGPARGYVKKRLTEEKIEFKHFIAKSNLELSKFYQTLDLYIISSRIEGGPKAVVEALASGVPIVSTKVGMVEDVIDDSLEGFLAESEDVSGLTKGAKRIIEDSVFRNRLIRNGLKKIKKYDHRIVADEYYKKIYKYLL